MSILFRIVAGLCLSGALTPCSLAAQPGMSDEPAVTARLIGETDALVPGETFYLGVDFEIAEGWHMYWKNPGESGAVARVALELPEWITAGTVQWPTPDRLLLPGGILDYVHHGVLTLIIPLTVGANAPVGAEAEIDADLWWLMCDDEICVPGTADLSMRVPVASSATASREAGVFERARRIHPVAPPEGGLRADWENGKARFQVPGATKLTFLPDLAPSPQPIDLATTGESEGERLIIGFDDAPSTPLTGTLVVRRASNKPVYWAVELAPPPPQR